MFETYILIYIYIYTPYTIVTSSIMWFCYYFSNQTYDRHSLV